jgi:DNA-binding response OmpR family regulator
VFVKKILMIDDERDICLLVKQNLEISGDYKVIVATNGRDGIAAASREKPDIILLDIIMPGMSGFEVLEKLKTRTDTTSIPVVMLTAVGTEEAKEKAMSLYNEEYLVKPVRTDVLMAKIGEVLSRHKT